MFRILWLHNWSAGTVCKTHLERIPLEEKQLFSESVDIFIKEVTDRKSTLFLVRRKLRCSRLLLGFGRVPFVPPRLLIQKPSSPLSFGTSTSTECLSQQSLVRIYNKGELPLLQVKGHLLAFQLPGIRAARMSGFRTWCLSGRGRSFAYHLLFYALQPAHFSDEVMGLSTTCILDFKIFNTFLWV